MADNRTADGYVCISERDRETERERQRQREREREREREIYVHTGACTDSPIYYIRAWFQARDIIEKMASNCGEEFGAPSVFCGPILGKVQMFW